MSSDEQQQTISKKSIFEDKVLERLPVMAAGASSALYVLGFIVVTSYLASKGIYDQSLLSTKYVLAGALTAVVLMTYYFFVWRKVVERIQKGVRWPQKLSEPLRVFLDTYYVAEHTFGCCFAALMLLTILGHPEYFPIQLVVFLAYGVDLILLKTGGYQRSPLVCFMATFALNSMAILLCLFFGYLHQPLLSLILVFLTITFTGSMVMASVGWQSGEDKHYGVFYIALYAILGVIAFGATVYEHISPKYGGAQPARVSVHLSSEADEEMKMVFKNNGGEIFLVLETGDASTFRIGDGGNTRFVKLDRGMVKGVVFEPTHEVSDAEKQGKIVRDAALKFRQYLPFNIAQ